MKTVAVSFALLATTTAFAQDFVPRIGLLTTEGMNTATIQRTVYVGTCPGLIETPVEAFFISETTPTAPGRRVVARNISFGMDNDPFPFTDRAYDKGGRSEHTKLAVDTEHRTRTLSVMNGNNEFEYSITENGTMIEQGKFFLQVNVQEEQVLRNQQCRWQPVCGGGGFPPGPNCRYEWVCSCF